ncbi:MAG: crotonase/enoyl-CoA hydratase family protein, partial [Hyphomicrobiales bacterium]|nr:crotonase/enoyl-CoA hydratase family protein [Hyphomicrobiales bacterium]
MSEDVEIIQSEAIQTIRLARPQKKNALTGAMYAALAEALETGEADEAIGARLIVGAPGAFCAGNDIKDFVAMAAGGGGLGEPILRFLYALARAKKPIVAAVDGLAIGVGTTMLLHCDYVLASPQSTFRTPFLDLGLVPEAGSSLLAPRLMGPARAFELLCLGAPFDAGQAAAAGIVNRIVDADALEETAHEVAREIAAKPREAMAVARRLVRGDPEEIVARIDKEAAAFGERLASPEAQAA